MRNHLIEEISEFHTKSDRAIVMFSGGFDSTVSLWWAMNHYKKVKAISVDYNQQHRQELDCAKKIIALTDIEHDIIKVDFPKHYWGLKNHLTRGQALLMVSIAALDIGREGADIVLGTLKTDPYRDSKPECYRMLEYILGEDNDKGEISIVTPLHALKDKTAVAVLGYYLGAPVHLSWSCRKPQNNVLCDVCNACRQRNMIQEQINQEYGIAENDLNAWLRIFGSPMHPSFTGVNDDVKKLANAFVQAGGIKSGALGWRYCAPDGSERLAPLIKHPYMEVVKLVGSDSSSNHIRACSFFEDGYMWEVAVCSDGSVAATERLPDIKTIRDELIKNTEI